MNEGTERPEDPHEESDDILALPGFSFSTPVVIPPNQGLDVLSFKEQEALPWSTTSLLPSNALPTAFPNMSIHSIVFSDMAVPKHSAGSGITDHAERLRGALAKSQDIVNRHRERLRTRQEAAQERA